MQCVRVVQLNCVKVQCMACCVSGSVNIQLIANLTLILYNSSTKKVILSENFKF